MQEAWRKQMGTMGLHPKEEDVKGPAGAVRCAMQQLGWIWPAAHILVSHCGRQMNLREVCPKDVEAMAKRDAGRCLGKQ